MVRVRRVGKGEYVDEFGNVRKNKSYVKPFAQNKSVLVSVLELIGIILAFLIKLAWDGFKATIILGKKKWDSWDK